ncbi:MAG TPA: Clp protease N-terminal domain-containing protein [Actinocrinis sp.]|nr:Clp protease N-terminal domain-containing protein [Actinocrinis sp.]
MLELRAVRSGGDFEHYIGTGHLLLGLIREGRGVAAKVLVEAGCDLDDLRDHVTRMIAPKTE